jgi:phage-related minor tail protein
MATLATLVTKLGLDASDFHKGLDAVETRSVNVGSSIRGFFTNVGAETLSEVFSTGIIGGIGRVTGAVHNFVSSGFEMNNAMELARAKINAFTKDTKVTAGVLDMVRERAAKTPFAFQEMVDAAAALGPAAKQSGMPLEALIAQAEVLAASNPGQGLEGAVFSLREALSGDFVSIVERFNLPKQRLNELKKQGVPAIKAITTAMAEMGLDADLVSQMSLTASGRLSTLQDTFTTLASKITQPIFDAASGGLGTLQAAIDKNMPAISELANLLGEGLAVIMGHLGTVTLPNLLAKVAGLADLIPRIVTPIREAAEAFKEWSAFGTEFGIQAMLQSLGESFPQFASLTTWLSDRVPAAFELGRQAVATFQAVVTEIGTFVRDQVIPAISELATWLQTNIPAAVAAVTAAFQEGGVTGVIQLLLDKLGELIPGLEPLTTWLSATLPGAAEAAQGWILALVTRFQEWWTQIGGVQGVLDTLRGAVDTLGSAISAVTDFVNDHVAAQAAIVAALTMAGTYYALTTIAAIAHGVATRATAAATWVMNTAQAALNVVMAANPIGLVVLALAGLVAAFVYAYQNSETFRAEIDKLWANFLRGIEVIKEWAAGVKERWNSTLDDLKASWQATADKVGEVWETIKAAFATALEIIKTTVSTKLDEVITFFTNLPGKVLEAVGNLGTTLLQSGKDLVQGLIDGILSIDIGAAISGALRGAVNMARNAIESRSPSKLTHRMLGVPMGEGVVGGFVEKMPLLKKRLVETIDNLKPEVPKKARLLGATTGDAFGEGVLKTTDEKLKLVKPVLVRNLGDPGMIAEATEKARNLGALIEKAVVKGLVEQSQDFMKTVVNLGDRELIDRTKEKGKEVGKALADGVGDGYLNNIGKYLSDVGVVTSGSPFGAGAPIGGVAQVIMPDENLAAQSAIDRMDYTLKELGDKSIKPWMAKTNERMLLDGGFWMISLAEGISGNQSAIYAAREMGINVANAINEGLALVERDIYVRVHTEAAPTASASIPAGDSVGSGGVHIDYMDLRGTPYSMEQLEARFQEVADARWSNGADMSVNGSRRRGRPV